MIARESQEILKLDYKQKVLLVSTVISTFILDLKDLGKHVRYKIGARERKSGIYGGTLIQVGIGKLGMKSVVVRPNNRLWLADMYGKVEKTIGIKFK